MVNASSQQHSAAQPDVDSLPVARSVTIAVGTVTTILVAVAICNAVLAARPFGLDPFSDGATRVTDLCSVVLFAAVVAATALANYAPTSSGALMIAASRVFPWMGVAAVAATGARLSGFDPYYGPSLHRFSDGAWGAEPLLLCAAGFVAVVFLIPRRKADARAGVMIVAMFLALAAMFLTGSGH